MKAEQWVGPQRDLFDLSKLSTSTIIDSFQTHKRSCFVVGELHYTETTELEEVRVKMHLPAIGIITRAWCVSFLNYP